MFQVPGCASAPPMDSEEGTQELPCVGFPIRTSPDRRLLTAPRGISLFAASFIGSWRLGILRALFLAYPCFAMSPRLGAIAKHFKDPSFSLSGFQGTAR